MERMVSYCSNQREAERRVTGRGEGEKLIGHWSFSISHLSFVVVKLGRHVGLTSWQWDQMANEKWKITNDQ